jgi:flagellar assembly factor FliW
MKDKTKSSALEETLIHFEEGLIGFAEYKTFVLKQSRDLAPFQVLQSMERDDLSFIVIDASHVVPNYPELIPSRDWASLGTERTNQVALAICSVGTASNETSVNLQAPILVDVDKMIGRQVILTDSGLSARHPLL